MFYHSHEDVGHLTLAECASSVTEWLKSCLTEYGEDANFPETLTVWEESKKGWRLLYVPTASEAECGTVLGAWKQTLLAYANPQAYKTEEWQTD